jgi:hypothetical protein
VNDLLNHPAVQGGLAPFVAALIVALVLGRVRLAGLAVVAGFCTTVYLVSGFVFEPLSVTRRIVLLALVAPVIGILVDFAFKPARLGNAILAVATGAATFWVFWPVLQQKDLKTVMLMGGGSALFVAWLVGFSQNFLSQHPIRAGAAGLGLGIGIGVTAVLGASALYGIYGISLAAGAGAFLLPQMIGGKKFEAGATFMLPFALTVGLLAAATLVLAQLPWYSLIALAFIPLAARLPAPEKSPLWIQAVAISACTLAVATAAIALTWQSGGRLPA